MFSICLRIALRNIIQNRRRSVLIGIAVFVSCLILMVSDSIFNGVEEQILKSYKGLQSGDVVLIWKDAWDAPKSDMLRLYRSTFNMDIHNAEMNCAVAARTFVGNHQTEIDGAFYSIRRFADVVGENFVERVKVCTLSKENSAYIVKHGIIIFSHGSFDATERYGVIVNEGMANKHGLHVNDWISLECVTVNGARNELDFKIVALYKNGAPWDNINLFMRPQDGQELYDCDSLLFDIGRIYLKNPGKISRFAGELNNSLPTDSVLHAVPYFEANTFFMSIASVQKQVFTYFVLFLFLVIAAGIAASIKMNIFERMREFGVLRAIGYGKKEVFSIVFFEVFGISFFALLSAFAINIIFVGIASWSGLPVGSGAASAVFGGERIFPKLRLTDQFFSLAGIVVLSLFAVFNAAITVCRQNIPDLLAKKQRKIKLFSILFDNKVRFKKL